MKKIIICLSALCLFTSCNDFLDREPFDQMDANDYNKNDKEVNTSVLACYNGIHKALDREFFLTEVRSDNARNRNQGPTGSTDLEITQLDIFKPETSNALNNAYWEAVYHNIANCNTVLESLGNVSDEALRIQFEGEARFIRGYHYFNLVRLYGPVFLIKKRISANESKWTVRSTQEDVYQTIIEDLDFAANNLPERYSDDQLGRADQWAAKTLLAKVYLTLAYNGATKDKALLEKAKGLLEDVRDNSPYELLTESGNAGTPYANIFATGNEMNKELIFVSRYTAGGKGIGSPFANYFAPSASEDAVIYGSGSGYNYPSEDLISAYKSETGDNRLDVNIEETWTNKVGVVQYVSWVKKYYSPVTVRYDAENDWPIIRYADVLLMLGEIINELDGPTTEACSYLNATRERAGLTAITPASRVEYREAMLKERRLEFAFENQRFFDLVRTNKIIDVMAHYFPTERMRNQSSGSYGTYYTNPKYNSYVGNPVLEKWQLLLPIPYNVIISATNATQNAGYSSTN